MNQITALSVAPDLELDSPEALEAQLRHIGATRYHNLHPFHGLLHGGKLNKGQVQAWALNRYYYQSTIPIKDAVVISRFRERNIRIEWRHRIEDHDGHVGSEGGIERWLSLVPKADVERCDALFRATREADANRDGKLDASELATLQSADRATWEARVALVGP